MISSNDDKGFTFRGRFRTANGASSLAMKSAKSSLCTEMADQPAGAVFIEKNGPGQSWQDTSGHMYQSDG